jgi:hypothetical protein
VPSLCLRREVEVLRAGSRAEAMRVGNPRLRSQVIMRNNRVIFFVTMASLAVFNACSTLEKASIHGFTSGYYHLDSGKKSNKVYVEVTEEKIDVHHQGEKKPDKDIYLSIPLKNADSLDIPTLRFRKQGLDVDITATLMKYRPSVYGLPQQLTTDLNLALYAGWRYDNYKLKSRMSPLDKRYYKITNFAYDFGFFAGPGTTLVNPFSTNNRITYEYNGMIIQTGIAGFLESHIASFGVAVGFDNLLGRDREIWIYNMKPWIGFIVGIALN